MACHCGDIPFDVSIEGQKQAALHQFAEKELFMNQGKKATEEARIAALVKKAMS